MRKRKKGKYSGLIIIISIISIILTYLYSINPEIVVYEEESTIPLLIDKRNEHIPLIKLQNLPVPNITIDFWKQCNVLSKDPDSRRFLAINNNSIQQWSPPLLYSFPGSGNTWARLLIDWSTGVYSGSFYTDKTLLSILPGEKKCDRSVSVIKVHPNLQSFQQLLNGDISEKCKGNGYSNYTKAIFLIRNPFDSIWSEFQRKKTGGSHSKGLKRSLRVNEIWHKVSDDLAQKYINMMSVDYYEMSQIAQTMIIKYEDLKNPSTSINELVKIISFIGLTDSVSVARLQPGELLPLPIPTNVRLKCAFALADNPRSHRPKYLDTTMYLTKNEVYNEKSVCRLWSKIGKYASIHGYTIYNNYSCS